MSILDWLAPLLSIGLGLRVLLRFSPKAPPTTRQRRVNWLFLIVGAFLLALQFFELLTGAGY